jgi:hypothetical protein
MFEKNPSGESSDQSKKSGPLRRIGKNLGEYVTGTPIPRDYEVIVSSIRNGSHEIFEELHGTDRNPNIGIDVYNGSKYTKTEGIARIRVFEAGLERSYLTKRDEEGHAYLDFEGTFEDTGE